MKDTSYNSSFITYDDDATWLITYADLMTLLLVFFVLLYSLAFFEKEKYMSRVESIRIQLTENEELRGVMEVFDESGALDRKITIEDITGLRSRETSMVKAIDRFVRQLDQDKNITTHMKDGKVIVTVSGEALFRSGSAVLNPDSLPVFDRMIQIFDDFLEYNINIKGHTDNIPISTITFPSNWELSAIRATTVLKYLISRGIKPQRLTATGYGDIMPLVPNTTDENKARNRRVEFVLEKKIKIEPIEPMNTKDQRETFRYVFTKDRSLSMVFKQKPVKILNISAGGMAFTNNGFKQYEADQINLFLDIPNFNGDPRFPALVRILNITKNGVCHCIFENLTIEEYEIIHKYVLEMQKIDLKTLA